MRSFRAHRIFLFALILAALALRFWRLDAMPLIGDEAYYLLWADRLAPAYFDHPAGIALLFKFSTMLLGRDELGVRWLNALLSTACVPLAYGVGRRYVSTLGGLFAAIAVAFGPVYVITGRVVYPDTLQVALILVNLLSLAPLLEGRGTLSRWALFGFTLALLFNVKLSSGFYAMALGIYLLGWRRDLLRQRGLWLALGLAALGLAPVIGWNAAHDWATVRWAIFQGQGFGLPQAGLRTSVVHAWRYLTPPAALLAVLAGGIAVLGLVFRQGWPNPQAGEIRARRHVGVLVLVAACLLLPILLSAANSPRNLGIGLLAVWPLVGVALAMPVKPGAPTEGGRPVNRSSQALYLMTTPLCLWPALYGAGTTAALLGPTRGPANVAARAIRSDAAGWPEFAAEALLPADEVTFAVDYGIAGQIAHYSDRPVYSAHPQFRLWGLPAFNDLTVLSQGYVLPELITERLQADFASTSGPSTWRYEAAGISKAVYVWRAHGRRVSVAQMLDDLDFLRLAHEAGKRMR